MSIKIGVIGMGRIAQDVHCPMICCTEGVELAGVYDIIDKRRQFAEEHYGVKAYSDLDLFLTESGADLVIISTPTNTHHDLAVKMMKAGKHVVVEKPIALSTAEADDMIAVAEENGVIISSFQNRRWDSDYLTIRKVIEDGLLGEVFAIESRINSYGSSEGYAVREFDTRWRLQKAYGGGVLYDWGSHILDQLLQMVPSPVKSVYGQMGGFVWTNEVDDYFKCLIRFENGVVAQAEASGVSRYPVPRWYVIGDKGTAVKNNFSLEDKVRVRTEAKGLKGEYIVDPVISSWNDYYVNLRGVLEKKEELIVKPSETRKVMQVIDAVRESARRGEAIML